MRLSFCLGKRLLRVARAANLARSLEALAVATSASLRRNSMPVDASTAPLYLSATAYVTGQAEGKRTALPEMQGNTRHSGARTSLQETSRLASLPHSGDKRERLFATFRKRFRR